jgi:hypothetical protein
MRMGIAANAATEDAAKKRTEVSGEIFLDIECSAR